MYSYVIRKPYRRLIDTFPDGGALHPYLMTESDRSNKSHTVLGVRCDEPGVTGIDGSSGDGSRNVNLYFIR